MPNLTHALMLTSLVSTLVVTAFTSGTAAVHAQGANEPAFARIEASGTLRCGYAVYPPFLIKDQKTGTLSGVFYELTEKIGALTGWKIDWAVQTSYPTPANANAIKDLASGKFDMLCGGIHWQVPWEQKQMWATPTPLFFSGFGVYVRHDDKRFPDGVNLRKLDTPEYTMVVNKDVAVDRLRKADFPNVGASFTGYGQMLKDVVDGKGDFTVIEMELGNQYIAANPGKIRNIATDKPMRAYGLSYQVAYGEARLSNVIDAAARELLWGGTVDYVLDKYETIPNTFYRAAMPYRPMNPRK